MDVFDLILAFDAFIVSFFTKFSHWFQRMTGRTNYFLAKSCGILFVCAMLLDVLNYWIPILENGPRPVSKGWAIFGIIIAILMLASYSRDFVFRLAKNEEDFTNNPTALPKGAEEDIQGPGQMIRPFMLLLGIGFFIESLRWAFSTDRGFWPFILYYRTSLFWMACTIYFSGVIPLPPCLGKIQAWLSSFQTSKLVTAESQIK